MNQSLNLLVLRPSDLNAHVTLAACADVTPTDFRNTPKDFNEADAVIYIEGTRTKILKDKYGKSGHQPYKASSFSVEHHTVLVVDGVLFCTFGADEKLGIEAGMLVCQPWTTEDDAAADFQEATSDDVLGATVSRQDDSGAWLKFHDVGFFIPDYTTDGL